MKSTIEGIFSEGQTRDLLSELLISTIKSHRDYDAGGNRDLMTLNKLSNWQKHNLLIPVVGSIVMPPKCRIFSEKTGASVVFGGDDITNSDMDYICVAGDDVQLDYGGGKPKFELRIHSDYAKVRAPMLDLLNQFKITTARSIKAFCETWPSEHNPVINIEEPI